MHLFFIYLSKILHMKNSLFNYSLFSLHELAAWLTHFLSYRSMFTAYYESWAFIFVHVDNDLFELLTNQLEKLSPLPFRLKYSHSSNVARTITNQRSSSLLPKRFNVRAWLRDRKTQVKISPKEPLTPASSSSSSMNKLSPSSTAIPSTKRSSTVTLPNTSSRRKLGSIPVPKRNQTVH